MERLEKIYEGKAKIIYTTSDPDLVIQYFKDDASAFDGKKKGTIVDKGVMNNHISSRIFQFLENEGVKTHFVETLNDREMLSGLASALELPVIQVVGMKLGCINHALLTAEAIEKDGLHYAGTMANCFGDMDVQEENLLTLRQHLPGAFALV